MGSEDFAAAFVATGHEALRAPLKIALEMNAPMTRDTLARPATDTHPTRAAR
jgi:hypothetical protein